MKCCTAGRCARIHRGRVRCQRQNTKQRSSTNYCREYKQIHASLAILAAGLPVQTLLHETAQGACSTARGGRTPATHRSITLAHQTWFFLPGVGTRRGRKTARQKAGPAPTRTTFDPPGRRSQHAPSAFFRPRFQPPGAPKGEGFVATPVNCNAPVFKAPTRRVKTAM